VLTIFTIPKPFTGHIGVIQKNAIKSWTFLEPKPEIILFGNEEGVANASREFNTKHVPAIKCNDYGTPYLDFVFDQAKKNASQKILCYINTDTILANNFIENLGKIYFKDFLVVGQRYSADVNIELDFSKNGWERKIASNVTKNGEMAGHHFVEYFIFPRDSRLIKIPPFVVGRPGWDNWLIYRSLELGIPVINATKDIMAIHQDHGYSHVKNRRDNLWNGPEGDRNYELAGGKKAYISQANHVMIHGLILPSKIYRFLVRVYYFIFKGKIIK